MAEQMIRRRPVKVSADDIRQKVYPIFPGYAQRLRRVGGGDEYAEHAALMEWVRSTSKNINRIHRFINASYDNTYRFMPYYDPIFVRKEVVPFQDFLLQQRRHQETPKPKQDAVLNRENADHVRRVIAEIKRVIDAVLEEGRFPVALRQTPFPKIERIRKIRIEPKEEGEPRRPTKKPRRRRTPSTLQAETVAATAEPTPTAVPYYLVNPKQQFMTRVAAAARNQQQYGNAGGNSGFAFA